LLRVQGLLFPSAFCNTAIKHVMHSLSSCKFKCLSKWVIFLLNLTVTYVLMPDLIIFQIWARQINLWVARTKQVPNILLNYVMIFYPL
jgi:hypothetical protein